MEEITLEKIDLVRERAGVTYREARDILAQTGGNVIEAIIELEGKKHNKWTEEFSVKSGEVIDKVKDLVREGNVSKIRVKHDGKMLVEIPVTLGAIGAVILPQLAALGVLVAVFKRCTIEVVRGEGEDAETQSAERDRETPNKPL
ncbi:MAG: DUF4342 domain-containing protein [Negativicutes bacterium]|nr:DUF4342 domain-containing protein [Negativicutes bacterium]